MRKTLVALLATLAMTSTVYAKDWNKQYNKQFHKTPQTQQYAQFISKQEAAQIALDEVWQQYQQNGRIDDVELKNKNGEAYYKVEVDVARGQEYDVYIDARTGEVKQMAVSYQQAEQIALDAVFNQYQQQGRIDDTELKYNNGRSFYEVEIKVPSGMEFEVSVDAQSGQVLRIKLDD